ncbi:hypothetical protein JTB14_025359 [Gonioctena quinquepunctata]|nr:hypothetical protein JTB14_025359 [Gonioctena quinquepunctata]
MVVPMESVSPSGKEHQYVGNQLILDVTQNKTILNVTGNNCKIKIGENIGLVKVIGCNCKVTILKGMGSIKYIGNCGKIYLGADVPEETVTYIGNGGKISSICDVSKSQNTTEQADNATGRNRDR